MTTRTGLVPQAEGLPLILVEMAVVAKVILSGLLAAAFAGLPDVGRLVRWGLSIVWPIHDLAAAGIVGLLMVAAAIIPEGRTTYRRIAAPRGACACGVVWVVLGFVGLVFSFAGLCGTTLSDPTFGTQLEAFVFQLEFLHVAAISSAMVLVVTISAALVRRRWSIVALAVSITLGLRTAARQHPGFSHADACSGALQIPGRDRQSDCRSRHPLRQSDRVLSLTIVRAASSHAHWIRSHDFGLPAGRALLRMGAGWDRLRALAPATDAAAGHPLRRDVVPGSLWRRLGQWKDSAGAWLLLGSAPLL